jgi:flagellar basal body-associated protein FliL
VSCTPNKSRVVSSVVSDDASHLSKLEAEPFLVRINDQESSKLVSLKLGYSGITGFQKSVLENKDQIHNLVISLLADETLKSITNDKGKNKFEKKLLHSLNEFITDNTFKNVNLIQIKEI